MPQRNVTGLSTIPAGVAKAGKVTGRNNSNNTRFFLDGTLGTEFESYCRNSRTNQYIWVPTSYLLLKVLGCFSDTVLEVDADATSVSAEDFYFVVGDLASYTCTNQGGADADFNDAVMAAGVTLEDFRENDQQLYRFVDAVKIDGSGTDLLIAESR